MEREREERKILLNASLAGLNGSDSQFVNVLSAREMREGEERARKRNSHPGRKEESGERKRTSVARKYQGDDEKDLRVGKTTVRCTRHT